MIEQTEPQVGLQTTFIDPDVSAAMTIYQRLEPLQNALGLANLSVGELQLFAMVAHHTGLDPFTKQIYAIKRGGKVMHQTGIDGYRSTAERTGQYRGSDAPEFEPCDCGKADSPPEHPKIARVTVYRAFPEGIRGQVGEARWHELKPKHSQNASGYGFQDDMWWQMPENQLAKCAEANGLRKQFPRVLGGVYIAEEMEQAGDGENDALVQAAAQPTAKERVAARAAALTEPKAPKAPKPAPEPVVATPEPVAAPPPQDETDADLDTLVQDGIFEPLPDEPPQNGPGAEPAPEPPTPPAQATVASPGGCLWRLEAHGGEIVDCAFPQGHTGDHSWTERAITSGGKVLRPQ